MAVVRWLFRTYATRDVSIRWMVEDLNRRGVPPPGLSAGLWQITAVHKILTRPTYVGDFCWNRSSKGKYHGVRGGEITATKRGDQSKSTPEDWLVVPNNHPALIDRQTFKQVQQRMVDRRDRKTPIVGGGNFLFTQLLYCGHCGWPMHGAKVEKGYNRYRCGRYNQCGTKGCKCNTLVEDVILKVILLKVEEWLGDKKTQARLKAAIRRQVQARSHKPDDKPLSKRLAELDKKINLGVERLLSAPTELAELASTQLQEWQAERKRLQGALAGLQRPRNGQADAEVKIDNFVNLIVDHLTEHGILDAAVLYESPFTDITPQGPDGIFTPQQVADLVTILGEVRSTALAA